MKPTRTPDPETDGGNDMSTRINSTPPELVILAALAALAAGAIAAVIVIRVLKTVLTG